MSEFIEQLVELQQIDREIDNIDGDITGVQGGLNERITALAAKEELIADLNSQIDTQKAETKTLELEMEEKLAHVRERQSKMMSVQTGREQAALLKEIEDGKKASKENEEKIVAIMETIEQLTTQVTEEGNLFKGEKKLVVAETEKVRLDIEKINKRKKSKADQRKKQAASIEPKLLQKYEILRERREGVALANVEDGVCQGCYMALPPQKYNMLLSGNVSFDCPTCQRIMYYYPDAA
ncbi:MAG: C4-type zinc ribbon domain-containing protein [Desulfotalea sp.]